MGRGRRATGRPPTSLPAHPRWGESSEGSEGSDCRITTQDRDVRRTLAYGIGLALFLTLAGALFLPALALAVLGFLGVVVTAAVITARGTSRWAYVWVAAVARLLWIAAIITYWMLWATAFNFADDNKPVPATIQSGSNAALVTGAVAFVALIGTAVIIQIRSGKLPKAQIAQSV